MLQGNKLRLRVVTRNDLKQLEAWNNDWKFQSSFNTFDLKPSGSLEQRFNEDGLISSRYGTLVVVTFDDTIIGDVSYHQVHYGPNEGSMAYNIGIALAPEHRGKEHGVEAQKLLAEYLFSTYPISRVEASTDVENIPEQRALEKAGFTREGILRRAQWRNGSMHDIIVYSKLRGE